MQPTEPTPSTTVQPSDQPAEVAEDSSGAEEKASPTWWQRLMGRHPEPEPSETEPQAASPPSVRTMTEEEFQKAIQSETDRREAKRDRERKAEERRKLRDEDPWQFAEQERQTEQLAQQNSQIESIFNTIGAEHDKHTIDPVMQALPKDEQSRILGLEGAGVGLEGRRLLVGEALKALEKHWKAEGAKDAETRLRKNAAFRKQVLAEMRGT